MNAGGSKSCTSDLKAWASTATHNAGISVETDVVDVDADVSSETSDSGAVMGRGSVVAGSMGLGWVMGGLGMGSLLLAVVL